MSLKSELKKVLGISTRRKRRSPSNKAKKGKKRTPPRNKNGRFRKRT